jgi:hypothetical protein
MAAVDAAGSDGAQLDVLKYVRNCVCPAAVWEACPMCSYRQALICYLQDAGAVLPI